MNFNCLIFIKGKFNGTVNAETTVRKSSVSRQVATPTTNRYR